MRMTASFAGAVLGATLQLSKIADKFPFPFNYTGYVIIFFSVLAMAWELVGIAREKVEKGK